MGDVELNPIQYLDADDVRELEKTLKAAGLSVQPGPRASYSWDDPPAAFIRMWSPGNRCA
jgi:hypothetical protein